LNTGNFKEVKTNVLIVTTNVLTTVGIEMYVLQKEVTMLSDFNGAKRLHCKCGGATPQWIKGRQVSSSAYIRRRGDIFYRLE
jgi:hypothetical protein